MGCGRQHGRWPCGHNRDCNCFHCEPHRRQGLPQELNTDGRPVWEPPILDYSRWIGDEYDKTRAAVMKWTGNDVVKTTNILDIDVEYDLLREYREWVGAHTSHQDSSSSKFGDHREHEFMIGLEGELSLDFCDVDLEFKEFGINWRKTDDERLWEVIPWPPTGPPTLFDEEMKELRADFNEDITEDNGELHQRIKAPEHTLEVEDDGNTMLSNPDPDVPSNHATSNSGPPASITTPGTKETPLFEQVPTSDAPTSHELKPATEICQQTGASTSSGGTRAPADFQSDVSISSTPPSDHITQWLQAATTIIRHMN